MLRIYPISPRWEEPDPGNAGVGTDFILCFSVFSRSISTSESILDMDVPAILEEIQSAFEATSWLERLAVVFGIIQVLLSRKNKISNYFFGIVSIVLTISVLYDARLYAEILLNGYYLVMSIYGLWYWKYKNVDRQEVQISRCRSSEWMAVGAIVVGGYFFLFGVLFYFTDSDVPMLDALVSSTAWAGMWLLAKRKLENWILLNLSNAIAIPLLVYKELYLFAMLTIILFIVAIFGYFKWKSILAAQSSIHAVDFNHSISYKG
ncbi:nicotinamide riboside transporter PnuC [Sphingobacterium suaedae]|uniref:Nicotinamide riboside transporter PnuC n=1 Tax=Sphingobacterium suaedae TaxID=1686402 RepID=A0ABW5KE70_9SPHI